MHLNLRKSDSRGQGLLEVIIGIGVIIAGTVGSVTLISATVSAGRSTNNRVVAASLAREAIEVVRNARDSNWLKMQVNEPGVTSFTGVFDAAGTKAHMAIPTFDQSPSMDAWSIGALPVGTQPSATSPELAIDCPIGSNTWKCSQVFLSANAYFQALTGTPGTASRYHRYLTLHPICRADADPLDGIADTKTPPGPVERIETDDGETCITSTGSTNEILVGLQVISTVRWTEGSGLKSFALEDRLYNWKYVQ